MTLARDFGPLLHLMRRCFRWMHAAWAKRELWRTDPMHPDIPRLVIAERELRP